MKSRIKVGIIGCGAIGSRIAQSLTKELKNDYQLSGLYDSDFEKTQKLAKTLKKSPLAKKSFPALLKSSQLIIEAINSNNVKRIVKQSLEHKKDVLVMSVGQLLNAKSLFTLAKKQHCKLLIPSGAIAGLDAIKSLCAQGFQNIKLTTKKPLKGFKNDPYLKKKEIDTHKIKKETLIFKGSVDQAVKAFPRNINVAATLSLACGNKNKVRIEIYTSPEWKNNTHEIYLKNAFGEVCICTKNIPCPDNPKTSFLAVLSAIQTLKQFCSGVELGT